MRKALVCQPDGIGSLAAALTQCDGRPMTEKQQAECTIESDGTGVFVVFEGVRIAKRGESGTPQAGTWVSLEPCYEVVGGTSEQDPLVVTRKDA
jgi:hypothetical protein